MGGPSLGAAQESGRGRKRVTGSAGYSCLRLRSNLRPFLMRGRSVVVVGFVFRPRKAAPEAALCVWFVVGFGGGFSRFWVRASRQNASQESRCRHKERQPPARKPSCTQAPGGCAALCGPTPSGSHVPMQRRGPPIGRNPPGPWVCLSSCYSVRLTAVRASVPVPLYWTLCFFRYVQGSKKTISHPYSCRKFFFSPPCNGKPKQTCKQSPHPPPSPQGEGAHRSACMGMFNPAIVRCYNLLWDNQGASYNNWLLKSL